MRANESPRRCKCDECRDAYSLLHEFDLFDAKGQKRNTVVVAQ